MRKKKLVLFFIVSFVISNLKAQSCFKQISAGVAYTVAIKTDGTLWAWGSNAYGQLGTGTHIGTINPVQIGTSTNWASVCAAVFHTVAIKTDGTLWAWGQDDYGQLGNGTITPWINNPIQVGSATNWASVSAGSGYTVAIKTNGTLWVWGRNLEGQLGDGTNVNRWSPKQIGVATNWASISAANFHTLAIKTDGSLWAWGGNNSGQLGDGTTVDKNTPSKIGSTTDWAKVITGYQHTMAIKTDGSLWAWGANYVGQLGDGTNISKKSPVQTGTATNWKSVTAGGYHTIALKTNGSLWAWGGNNYGQLGDGTTVDKNIPLQIGTATNWAIATAGEYYHSLALKTDGSLWAWGSNNVGQLGDGTTVDKNSPLQIVCPCTPTSSTTTFSNCGSYLWNGNTYISSGTYAKTGLTNAEGCDSTAILNLTIKQLTSSTTNITITTSQLPYSWNGYNYNFAGNYTAHLTNAVGCDSAATLNLTVVSGCFKKVIVGDYHTVAIKTDGTLWAWGHNYFGQLGDGTTVTKISPVQIGTANDWASVNNSFDYTIALKTDGTLWAWGYNFYGQLGDGTGITRKSPVQIGIANNWASVGIRNQHTEALKTDGSLWAWGLNNFGQLGDGTTVDKYSPVQIGAANNWASVGTGDNHTVAIKTDGSLWAWGKNSAGQLGDGTGINKKSPMQIGTATNWAKVSAGDNHTLAIKTDGSLWAWGWNSDGQLGDGTGISKYSPVQIGTATNWSRVSAGNLSNIALNTDGFLGVWGWNGYGQLGDGTRISKNSPVQLGCFVVCTPTTSSTTISNCGSYVWNGITYTSSGIYTKTGLFNVVGCDSTATLNLTLNTDFSGNITHPTKGNINNVGVNYNGATSNFNGGKYSYNCITAGTNVKIKPTKNNDIKKNNGVSSIDVILVTNHILNKAKLNSPYKLIAADVNNNKTITNIDIIFMKRLILGIDTSFTGNRLWAFVDSAYTFPDTTNPFPYKDSISFSNLTSNKTNQSFIGVKLGDVNYDWNAAVARGMATKPLELEYQTSNLYRVQNPIKVAITAKNFKDLTALQYTFNFNHKDYEFVGIENNKLGIEFNQQQANNNGNISFLWADAKGAERSLEDGSELFTLLLKPKQLRIKNDELRFGEVINNLQLTINNSITEIEAWDKDNLQHNIVLTKQTIQQEPQTPNTKQWTVSPNPNDGNIVISLTSNTNKTVVFELSNALGKILYKQSFEAVKGNNTYHFNLNKNTKLTSGIYFIKAIGLEGENVKRLVVNGKS